MSKFPTVGFLTFSALEVLFAWAFYTLGWELRVEIFLMLSIVIISVFLYRIKNPAVAPEVLEYFRASRGAVVIILFLWPLVWPIYMGIRAQKTFES